MNFRFRALKRGAPGDSFQLWAAACALVSLALAIACFLTYRVEAQIIILIKFVISVNLIRLNLHVSS